jgi:hypothetical protein
VMSVLTGLMIMGAKTLRIMGLFLTLNINDTEHNDTQHDTQHHGTQHYHHRVTHAVMLSVAYVLLLC